MGSNFAFPSIRYILVGLAFLSNVTATSILDGRYQSGTNVQGILNLALDTKAMRETSNLSEKLEIYQNGQNAEGTAADGSTLSLASLSLNAGTIMANSNPLYNIFRHAFLVLGDHDEGEPVGNFDGAPIEEYANTVVNDLFDLNVENIETEAALVMNVWMVIVHELFTALSECAAGEKDAAEKSLDRAVALWVGEGQSTGDNEGGHMLYNLAEIAGERFLQDEGETIVNTNLMKVFLSMQSSIAGDSCTSGSSQKYVDLREQVQEAISLMTIPLIQTLIHHIKNVGNEGGSNFVELYALALIPRVAACDPAAYEKELRLDVLRELTPEEADAAVIAIQDAYSCFQVTCADIGDYMGGIVETCTDKSDMDLVGYTSTRDGARRKSYIDRDILQIDIFMKFQALDNAADWYQHGWNAPYSLQDLARNQVVPTIQSESQYQLFANFYDSDTFAHNLLVNILEELPPFNSEGSVDQIRELTTGILKYVVVYLTAASALQYAQSECTNGNTQSALDYWDTAVAFYVGSMEGEATIGDPVGGELLFATASELCDAFGTCSSTGTRPKAKINDAIVEAFVRGEEYIESNSCSSLDVENNIIPKMTVPLLQGLLQYASFNAGLSPGTLDGSLAIGYAFSKAVLPVINVGSTESAEIIRAQMEFQDISQPVPGGFEAVANALRDALPNMNIDCTDIGTLKDESGGNLCSGPSPVQAPTQAPARAPVSHNDDDNPENLAFGRYTFSSSTIADSDGSFALDIRDMFTSTTMDEALSVYTGGPNLQSGDFPSLASLSTAANARMNKDPIYNIFKYSYYNEGDLQSTSQTFPYADDFIGDASTGSDKEYVAEAAVVLNIWMYIIHQLHEAASACEQNENADYFVDSAVALWIGKGQAEGKYDYGWMMYAIGQSAAKFYGLAEGEAPINSKLMTQFNEAQNLAKQCSKSSAEFLGLRRKVAEISVSLSKPLALSLLFHMIHNNRKMVELYSAAVVPQSEVCSSDTTQFLKTVLLSGNYNKEEHLNDNLKRHLAIFFQCLRITCDDLRITSTANSELQELVADICLKLDYTGQVPLAGYVPKFDVEEASRIDRDILAVRIFLATGADDTALDIYEHGYYAYDTRATGDFISLRSLAMSEGRSVVPEFQLYEQFLESSTYADDLVLDVIKAQGDYAAGSRYQRTELVVRSLQVMVMYMAVMEKMNFAIQKCDSSDSQESIRAWDTAVAFYVGSVEGTTAGGSGSGEQLYGFSNEMCVLFGTCEANGESEMNGKLMSQFSSLRDALENGQCDHVRRTLTDDIVPEMSVPYVQGLLNYAITNENQSPASATSPEVGKSIATGHVLAEAMRPLVGKVNETSATLLKDSFGWGIPQVPGGYMGVYEALSFVFRGLGINCEDIGTRTTAPQLGACSSQNGEQPDAPHPDTPTDLGGNLYKTTTYVQDRANLALDVKDMEEALLIGNTVMAKEFYDKGSHSEMYDDNGKFVKMRSLSSLSLEGTREMEDEPLFNIYLYALTDNNGKFQSKEGRLYADTLVNQAFDAVGQGSSNDLPVEAALILNLWMYVSHTLYDAIQACRNKEVKDKDGIHFIDIAAAYWIGDGQVAGDEDKGHLLYALTEKMGQHFGMDSTGQSRTNSNILRLFNEAKNELSLPSACSESPVTYNRLSAIVNKILAQMSIPIIQGLIHNLLMNDRERVKIYANAFVPLMATCNPSSYSFLREKLLEKNYNVVEVDDIIGHVRMISPCLNLRCDDIGTHDSEIAGTSTPCNDPDILTPMAGYRPSTDVRQYSRLDLDILEMDILLQMGAFEAAETIYTHGKHVDGLEEGSISLFHLATTSSRNIVPIYDSFKRYYESDTYADKIIREALAGSDPALSNDQRRYLVIRSSQMLVLYFGALQYVYEAVSNCESEVTTRSISVGDAWDKAAALLIGHLEGPEEDGSSDGYMTFDLAQEYCDEFSTCGESTAELNEQIVELLYAGRGAALGSSCRGLKKSADEISALVSVPIIQSALSASLRLSSSKDPHPTRTKVEGYIAAQAVLPLVSDASSNSAATIREIFTLDGPSRRRNAAKEAFSAFAKVYSRLGIDCTDVGKAGGFDACKGAGQDGKLSSAMIGTITGVVGVCLLCCIGLFVCSRKRRDKRLPENNPQFIASSSGELNNHSMALLEKVFSDPGRSPSGDRAETEALTVPASHIDASPREEEFDEDQDFERIPVLDRKECAPDII